MTTDLPSPARPLRIGTRGSPLALAQAHETRGRLMAAFDLPEEEWGLETASVDPKPVLEERVLGEGGDD